MTFPLSFPISCFLLFLQPPLSSVSNLDVAAHVMPPAMRSIKFSLFILRILEFPGCSWGKLVIILPEEMWLPILPKSSQDKLLQTEYNQMALDLAQLLVDYQFAQSFQGMEEEICKFSSECGQAHPNTR